MAKQIPTFEDALKGLERSASDLMKPEITLEEALKSFEAGVRYYKQCDEILSAAKQKIEVYSE